MFSDEGTERSSTEDISSRAYSPSLSSSNEDILKPTAKIGDRGDCPPSSSSTDILGHHVNHGTDWLLRTGAPMPTNLSGFPQHFINGSKINSIDLDYLKDLELSSTTESHAPSTLPPNNREIESCTSFEYHENGMIKSPFQREIQRLLDSSASKIPVPIGRTSSAQLKVASTTEATGSSTATTPNSHKTYTNSNLKTYQLASASNMNKNKPLNNTNLTKYEFEPMEKPNNYSQVILGGGGAVINGKHPVGLEAIKEIAKNTSKSDSSQM